MAHSLIIVDGATLLDANTDEWQLRPPEQLRALLDPGTKPTPWIKASMIALADAAALALSVRIDVTTHATDWTLKVVYA